MSNYENISKSKSYRNGECEPKIIGKYNRSADGMAEKILSLYACGIIQRDITEQINNLYDVEISPNLVSKVSKKIMSDVTALAKQIS